jgi:Arc/MetJ-type ribon-helix-helix transcriptional regulator
MTIHLPEDLERYVHEQVQAGRFPSEDDVIHDALQRHRDSSQVTSNPPFTEDSESSPYGESRVHSTPNVALLAALKEVDEIQQGVNPSKVSPTREYMDEARSGAMYGYDDAGPDTDSD